MKKEVTEFLKESNAIEDVWDDDSLKHAKTAWNFLIKQDKLTTSIILKTHKLLMRDKLYPNERGYWRRVAVYIGGRAGANYLKVPELMDEWVTQTNALLTGEIKKDTYKTLHIKYENIHPFIDGNGRTGRMFMNWTRLKNKMSILIIKEKEKQEYYKWFD